MILGESHYQWDKGIPLTQDLTTQCIEEQISDEDRKQFWTNIAIAFLNRYPTKEDKYRFWHSVAFYNYIQANVGFGPRVRPTPDMWRMSQAPFFDVLKELKPEVIIVLGYTLWNQLPDVGRHGPRIDGAKQDETWRYSVGVDTEALAYAIRHPSAGFSGRYWHPFVMRAIELA